MESIFHAKRTIEIDKKKKKKKNSILGWECFAQRPLGQRISIVDMKSNLCYPLIDALRIKTARDHLVLYSFYRDISMASLHFSPEQFPQRHRITFIELIARYIYIYIYIASRQLFPTRIEIFNFEFRISILLSTCCF